MMQGTTYVICLNNIIRMFEQLIVVSQRYLSYAGTLQFVGISTDRFEKGDKGLFSKGG